VETSNEDLGVGNSCFFDGLRLEFTLWRACDDAKNREIQSWDLILHVCSIDYRSVFLPSIFEQILETSNEFDLLRIKMLHVIDDRMTRVEACWSPYHVLKGIVGLTASSVAQTYFTASIHRGHIGFLARGTQITVRLSGCFNQR
jgi:hypothetical protein